MEVKNLGRVAQLTRPGMEPERVANNKPTTAMTKKERRRLKCGPSRWELGGDGKPEKSRKRRSGASTAERHRGVDSSAGDQDRTFHGGDAWTHLDPQGDVGKKTAN
jgi:hypothetical protein